MIKFSNLKQSLLILLLFVVLQSINAQVNSVDYQLKYNSSQGVYECFIVVKDGSATSPMQRIQTTSQYSLVVPTGSNLNIVENYMPLANNVNYTGTIPCNWLVSTSVLSPEAQPESDFYSITPSLAPTCYYNNLSTNDAIKLFSFSITNTSNCLKSVRIFNNESDPDSHQPGMNFADFSNEFKIGGYTALYNNNLPSVDFPIVNTKPVVSIEGPTNICENETANLLSNTIGIWESNDLNIAKVNNDGLVTPLSPGIVNFTFTDISTGCIATTEDIIINKVAEIIMDVPSITMGETTVLSTLSDGVWTWKSNTPSIASIDNSAMVTGITPGKATFKLSDANTGCFSMSDEFIVLESPNNTIDLDQKSNYDLFPNPINNKINLSTSSTTDEIVNLNIYNDNGRLMFSREFSILEGRSPLSIDFENYSNGLYFIHIVSENNIEYLKFVKAN